MRGREVAGKGEQWGDSKPTKNNLWAHVHLEKREACRDILTYYARRVMETMTKHSRHGLWGQDWD